jgi:hypothetical protein
LVDGLIVQLARRARRTARSAAKGKGDPALSAEFELTKLYRERHSARAATATSQ